MHRIRTEQGSRKAVRLQILSYLSCSSMFELFSSLITLPGEQTIFARDHEESASRARSQRFPNAPKLPRYERASTSAARNKASSRGFALDVPPRSGPRPRCRRRRSTLPPPPAWLRLPPAQREELRPIQSTQREALRPIQSTPNMPKKIGYRFLGRSNDGLRNIY